MMRFALTALPIIALPAIALSAPAAAQTAYRALGTEPFWNLTIDARTIRLEQAGERPVVVPRPIVQSGSNGERYVTRNLVVDVSRARCSDGMSDRVYPDMVLVKVGQRSLRGCGSAIAGGRHSTAAKATVARPAPTTAGTPAAAAPPPSRPAAAGARAPFANSLWTVWQVNGRAIKPARPLLVHFTGDIVEGKLCNLFRAPYTLVGGQVKAGAITARRSTCGEPEATAETRLFAMLRQPVRATVSRWGTLILAGGSDTITLRPFRR